MVECFEKFQNNNKQYKTIIFLGPWFNTPSSLYNDCELRSNVLDLVATNLGPSDHHHLVGKGDWGDRWGGGGSYTGDGGGRRCDRRGRSLQGWVFGADNFQGMETLKPGENPTRVEIKRHNSHGEGHHHGVETAA